MPTNPGTVNVTQGLGALIGRVLMSPIFIWGGYGKLMAAAATKASFASLGLPLPGVVWFVAVVVELLGGLALLLGLQTRWVALVLGLWSIGTALIAHTNFADTNMLIHFMKNMAIAGGFAFVAVFGAGRYALDWAFARGTHDR